MSVDEELQYAQVITAAAVRIQHMVIAFMRLRYGLPEHEGGGGGGSGSTNSKGGSSTRSRRRRSSVALTTEAVLRSRRRSSSHRHWSKRGGRSPSRGSSVSSASRSTRSLSRSSSVTSATSRASASSKKGSKTRKHKQGKKGGGKKKKKTRRGKRRRSSHGDAPNSARGAGEKKPIGQLRRMKSLSALSEIGGKSKGKGFNRNRRRQTLLGPRLRRRSLMVGSSTAAFLADVNESVASPLSIASDASNASALTQHSTKSEAFQDKPHRKRRRRRSRKHVRGHSVSSGSKATPTRKRRQTVALGGNSLAALRRQLILDAKTGNADDAGTARSSDGGGGSGGEAASRKARGHGSGADSASSAAARRRLSVSVSPVRLRGRSTSVMGMQIKVGTAVVLLTSTQCSNPPRAHNMLPPPAHPHTITGGGS